MTAFDSREPEVIIRTVLTALRAAFAVYYLERFPGDVEALKELLGIAASPPRRSTLGSSTEPTLWSVCAASPGALPRVTTVRYAKPRKLRANVSRPRQQWGREDSNLRRLSRRVYSPFPLATRAHPRAAAL